MISVILRGESYVEKASEGIRISVIEMHCLMIALLVILVSMDKGKISRYEIRAILGSGGMATVYRAYDPEIEREVALKILKPEMFQDAHLRRRFERETKLIAKLGHEAIVPVYDVGRDNNQSFFVMPLMTGGTLFERLQNEPMSPAQIIRIIQRIAPALDEAHAKGIIHRDLKPANILFDEHNNSFISDFGIAKTINVPIPDTLTDGFVMGTPRYMSPEQARGEPVDARSDIYSLGVIVFEMLISKTRFDAILPLGLIFREEKKPIPRVLDTNPSLPAGIQTVIDKVLAKDRDLRYRSATEFADALATALSEPLSPTKPANRRSRFASRFWAIGAAIIFALVIFAVFGIPIISLPDTPTHGETAVVTIMPSTTASPPPVTARVMPTAVPTISGIGGADSIALTANNEVYLVGIDGRNPESLTQTGIPKFDLQWLPGGKELLYVEGNCVYLIAVDTDEGTPEQLACFMDSKFQGFRVSPDGKRVAISIANRLLVLPFDRTALSEASTAFELQQLDSLCLDYADVTVNGALWSADGKRLAIRYQSVLGQNVGETIRVIQGNWERCQQAAVFEWDEFPADHFVPDRYEKSSRLPSYQWDGNQQFLLNSLVRNKNYGDLYFYDMSTERGRKINPINDVCCYGSATFSPDGTHILLVFQDLRLGSKSENKLYYIPMDQIDTATALTPLPLPRLFFKDPRENIQLALHPSVP